MPYFGLFYRPIPSFIRFYFFFFFYSFIFPGNSMANETKKDPLLQNHTFIICFVVDICELVARPCFVLVISFSLFGSNPVGGVRRKEKKKKKERKRENYAYNCSLSLN
eukprot:TRINITY_DN4972_c0_g1_i1.p3 TRINITY_DN4972_c0_g1~~TRINITY_DN4972_c0_g1_i1.p3  ORF type:complete len:108 (-),score=6.81 TRINITY_DN4972_c0_g1_i1:364-687(-)